MSLPPGENGARRSAFGTVNLPSYAFSVALQTSIRESLPGALVTGSSTQPETAEAVLFDPFIGRKEPAPKKPPLAPAALAAALLSLLPIGSLVAIFAGISGLRQTKLGTMRGRKLAIASIALGSVFTIGYTTAAIALSIHYVDEARVDERHEQAKWDRKQKERQQEERKAAPPEPTPNATTREPPVPIPAAGTWPQKTEERLIGSVPVVDIGVSEPSLSQALLKQAALAKAEGREVMVNVMSSSCEPCTAQFKTVSDPLMQKALAKTRLVRVSIEVFRDDLIKLQMRVVPLPWYFLLRADGTPRDGINGGEWGEDVATNIAPIIGPFARGELKQRKQAFKPAAPNGTFL